MERVVVLSETEFEDLENSHKELKRVLKELEERANSKDELQEFVKELLDIE